MFRCNCGEVSLAALRWRLCHELKSVCAGPDRGIDDVVPTLESKRRQSGQELKPRLDDQGGRRRMEQQMAIPGVGAEPAIIKASVADLPKELNALWRAAGWILKDTVVVDGRHLVLVFFVDREARNTGGGVPGRLTKYTDVEDYAPYRAKWLKLATLRHYREQHRDLEGTRDPMEGRSRVSSTLEEMCRRHGVHEMPRGADLVEAKVTYETEDTSLIYCTSRSMNRVSRYEQWKFASRICNVQTFALSLGTEFARQRDAGRHAPVTGLTGLSPPLAKVQGWSRSSTSITDPSSTMMRRATSCLRACRKTRGAWPRISSSGPSSRTRMSTASFFPLLGGGPLRTCSI